MPEQLALEFPTDAGPPTPRRKTFRYRLYPTRRQAETLRAQLEEASRPALVIIFVTYMAS
jgi:hypothetical protein